MSATLLDSARRRRAAYKRTEVPGPPATERLTKDPNAPLLIASNYDRTAQHFFAVLRSSGRCVNWICYEDLIQEEITYKNLEETVRRAPGVYHRDLVVDPGDTALVSAAVKAAITGKANLLSPSLTNSNWSKPRHSALLAQASAGGTVVIPEWIIREYDAPDRTLKKAMGWYPAYVETAKVGDIEPSLAYLQQQFDGDEYRVHIVDDVLVAHQLTRKGIDYRRDGLEAVTPAKLPTQVVATLQRLAVAEGSRFCGIDILMSPLETFVIEVNPMPGYHSYEARAARGTPITDAIHEVLSERINYPRKWSARS
ncbi:hypothetical protein LCM19_08835 [Qipengyuania flava]|nr:hypothetical protein [Qipengyuania flava]